MSNSGMLGIMSQSPMQPSAGWYPDPAGGPGERFWDGQAWSQATRDEKVTASVPAAPSDPAPTSHTAPQGVPSAYYAYPGVGMGKPVPVQGGFVLAGFWWRVLGYIIDGLIIGVIDILLTSTLRNRVSDGLMSYLVASLEALEDPTSGSPGLPMSLFADFAMLTGITIVLWALYRTLTVGFMQASVGQKICGLRVAIRGDEGLKPVGWKAAILRGVLGAVFYQFIGFFGQISCLFTDRKQTIPDMLSNTVVVNTREAVR